MFATSRNFFSESVENDSFYEGLQKKLTDYVKRLLGVSHLALWEGRPVVAPVLDIDEAKRIIAYFYANATRANLVRSIEHYPGLTTWKEFQASQGLDAEHSRKVPWIRCTKIKKIGARSLTRREDRKIASPLKESAVQHEVLVVKPNYWLNVFNIEPSEVQQINAEIMQMVAEHEAAAEKERTLKDKQVLGPRALREARFYRPHTPKKKERRIFVRSSDTDLRRAFIQHVKYLCALCREFFKARLFDKWPPGMFRPPIGRLVPRSGFKSPLSRTLSRSPLQQDRLTDDDICAFCAFL